MIGGAVPQLVMQQGSRFVTVELAQNDACAPVLHFCYDKSLASVEVDTECFHIQCVATPIIIKGRTTSLLLLQSFVWFELV